MKHGDLTLNEVLAVADYINIKALAAINATRPDFEAATHGHETLGRLNAICVKLGFLGEGAIDRFLSDRLELIAKEPGKIEVREKERVAVDSNGRFIFENFGITEFTNANWSYGFDRSIQPDYPEILERLQDVFQMKDLGITVAQFEDKAEKAKHGDLSGPYANLFEGKCARPFPIVIPAMKIPAKKLGDALAEKFIPSVKRRYLLQFPRRTFNNYCKGTLEGQVTSFPGSRQDQLIAALAEGPQVLWVLMNCLQGGSFNADRELVQHLPKEFSLGGTIANGTVIAVYPEIAAAISKNPLYFNAADVWGSSDALCFRPYDSDLDFGSWSGLGGRVGGCSGSVVLRCVV